jgi:hypothetical protein
MVTKNHNGSVSFLAEYFDEVIGWYYHQTIPDPKGDYHEKHFKDGKLVAEGILKYSKIKRPEFKFYNEPDIPDSKFDLIIYV